MLMMSESNHKLWLGVTVLVALIGGVIYLALRHSTPPVTFETTNSIHDIATLEGVSVCLAEDGAAAVPGECLTGLREDGGAQYALDLTDAADQPAAASFAAGQRLRVSGLVVPVETLSAEQWQRYDIIAVMAVEAIEALE